MGYENWTAQAMKRLIQRQEWKIKEAQKLAQYRQDTADLARDRASKAWEKVEAMEATLISYRALYLDKDVKEKYQQNREVK